MYTNPPPSKPNQEKSKPTNSPPSKSDQDKPKDDALPGFDEIIKDDNFTKLLNLVKAIQNAYKSSGEISGNFVGGGANKGTTTTVTAGDNVTNTNANTETPTTGTGAGAGEVNATAPASTSSAVKAPDAATGGEISPINTNAGGGSTTNAATPIPAKSLETKGKNYKRAVEMLVTDMNYIWDNIGSLKSSPTNSKRADVLLQFLIEATRKRTAEDFTLNDVNLNKLLQIIAKLKLWVPPELPDIAAKTATKKEEAPFVSRKEKDEAATKIVKELFGLRCNQWGMDGLLNSYSNLTQAEKLSLLCFSGFKYAEMVDSNGDMTSESLKIKKKILIHWWVAEGFIDLHRQEFKKSDPAISDSPTPPPQPDLAVSQSQTPTPNPTPAMSQTPNPTPQPDPAISQSPNPTPPPDPAMSQTPNPTPQPDPAMSQSPDPTPQPDPAMSQSPDPTPRPNPTPQPDPAVSQSPDPTPQPDPAMSQSPDPTPQPDPAMSQSPDPAVSQSPNPAPQPDPAVSQSPDPTPPTGPAMPQSQNPTPLPGPAMPQSSNLTPPPTTPLDPVKATVEEIGEHILKVLIEKGFIEPVTKKARESSRVTMHPFVHSFVTALAKRAGFFDISSKDGKLTPSFGLSQRACLVKYADKLSSCKLWEMYTDDRNKLKRFGAVQTLFNVNEPIIDIKPEWFSRMMNLVVLHLGSWRSDAVEHIEVEDAKFLEDLKLMDKLKLFSLQGVSTIMKLTDSVCKLENLVILDLRECHNLEELPAGIGSLRSLTHLDITNCHLLTKLPKGISLLSNLEVLKGFVIYDQASDRKDKDCALSRGWRKAKGCVIHDVFRLKNKEVCSLEDLEKLIKLRHLTLVVNIDEFPKDEEVQVFRNMRTLEKLKISWEKSFKKKQGDIEAPKESSRKCGWCFSGGEKTDSEKPSTKGVELQAQNDNVDARPKPKASGCLNLNCCEQSSEKGEEEEKNEDLSQIKKLELWCYPEKDAPNWLHPDQLKNLKKLYIKGGELDKVPGDKKTDHIQWKNVTTLRLKYLPNLEISWLDLKDMFPKMTYLEKYECKQLLYFPCDQEGVWQTW